jgi:hypothetical protein
MLSAIKRGPVEKEIKAGSRTVAEEKYSELIRITQIVEKR